MNPNRLSFPFSKRPSFLFTKSLLACLLVYGLATAQHVVPEPQASTPTLISKAEKLEARVRVEYIKATKDIHCPVIQANELLKMIDDTNLILIDIRQPKEQAVSMLPHALTTAEFAQNFRRGVPTTKRIVVYCTIGYRSGKYAETLQRQGIKAENLVGGVLAWSFVGGEFLTKNSKGERVPTNQIHTYDKDWNLVHPDYIGVW